MFVVASAGESLADSPKQPAEAAPAVEIDHTEGRRRLVTWAALIGMNLGAVGGAIAGVEFQPFMAMSVGSGLAAGAGTFLVTRGRTVTRADAEAAIAGGSLAMATALVFSLELADNPYESRQDERDAMGLALGVQTAGVVAGAVGGYLVSRHHDATLAQSRMVATSGAVAGLHALAGFLLVPPGEVGVSTKRAAQLSILAADAGALGGYYLASELRWSHRRFTWIQTGTTTGATIGFVGALVARGADASRESRRIWGAGLLAGMYLGGGAAWLLTRGDAPTERLGGPRTSKRAVTLAPTVVDGAPGLLVAGTF